MATYTSSGDGYFTDVVTASHTSSDTIIIRQSDTVTGNVAIDCYDMYVSGNFNTMSGSTSFNVTTANKLQVGIGTASDDRATFTPNASTLSIASGALDTLGLFLKENAEVAGGSGEWFVGTLNADGGNDNKLTMTSGACWINGSYNDKIAFAMRGNTTFNANGGLIGICGSGTQYYYERNNTSRVFNNFCLDKVVGRGGGGCHVANGTPIATSLFAPESSGIPEKMTVLRFLHNNGGIFDLLGQSNSGGVLPDVPSNCMNLNVSGNMQQGGGWGGSLGDPQNWRGTAKLLTRSADVDLVSKNVWSTHSSPYITSGSNLNGGWTGNTPETGTDGQTDSRLVLYNSTYPYAFTARGDSYVSGGTARIKMGPSIPWIGDGQTGFAYDNFVSGNTIYSRIVPPTGNNAAFFDGEVSDQYASQADATVYDLDSNGTVSTWVYITSGTSNTDTYAGLVTKGCAAGWDTDGWGLSYFASNATYMSIRSGSTTSTAAFTNTLLDQWFHLAGTWDGSNIKIYQNGLLKATTAATHQPAQTTTDVRIASDPSGRTLEARIADVRLYSDAKDATFISGTLYATNPATDFLTTQGTGYGKYASSGTNMVAWWKLNRTTTGTTSLADSSVTDAGNLSVTNGPIRCHSGYWQIGGRNANSASMLNSYQSEAMGGILSTADYPETAYGAADGRAWALDCATGSLTIIAPTESSGNSTAGNESRLYQTMPNYGHVGQVAIDEDYWWHFWDVTMTNGDWGTTEYKVFSYNENQCFFTRIHGDFVIGHGTSGMATYGLKVGKQGGDFYEPRSPNAWAYYTTQGPYGDLIIDGALVIGNSGAFDYAGTRDTSTGRTEGWNYGNAYIDQQSNQNFIIPPMVQMGWLYGSGGNLRFAKRNPIMCDYAGIGVAEHGLTPVDYPGSGAGGGGTTWTKGRLLAVNYTEAPPVPTGSLWDNEGGSRGGNGAGSVDLPLVTVTGNNGNMYHKPWYQDYMSNRSIHLQHIANDDIFVPSSTDLANTAYDGDLGCNLWCSSSALMNISGKTLFTLSGTVEMKSTPLNIEGNFYVSAWTPNGSNFITNISGNYVGLSGTSDGYNKNEIGTGHQVNIGGNLQLESGSKIYTSGAIFNVSGAFINDRGVVVS